MIQTIEAAVDGQGVVHLSEAIQLPAPRRAPVTILEEPARSGIETALLSEASLATDWNRPEEDEAWSHI